MNPIKFIQPEKRRLPWHWHSETRIYIQSRLRILNPFGSFSSLHFYRAFFYFFFALCAVPHCGITYCGIVADRCIAFCCRAHMVID